MNPVSWFIHTCTKKSVASYGAKRDPVYGSATTFICRVEKTRKLVRNTQGKEVVTTHVLVSQTEIKPTDIIWFPSISGETADDTSSDDKARTPTMIETATTKSGAVNLWRVHF